jgi:hypothetical protein
VLVGRWSVSMPAATPSHRTVPGPTSVQATPGRDLSGAGARGLGTGAGGLGTGVGGGLGAGLAGGALCLLARPC